MVFIITGKRDSGKTTTLLNIYKEKRGAGVVSIKKREKGYDSYYLIFPGSAQEPVLLATENPEFKDKKDFFKFKRFYFNERAFKKARVFFTEMIALSISPLYLDEVGELELNGMGFHDICLKLMRLQTDVYVTVRDTNIERFLEVFKPEKYRILKVKE